jgi:hypothetical protein
MADQELSPDGLRASAEKLAKLVRDMIVQQGLPDWEIADSLEYALAQSARNSLMQTISKVDNPCDIRGECAFCGEELPPEYDRVDRDGKPHKPTCAWFISKGVKREA